MKLVHVFLFQLVCTVFAVLGAGEGGIESYVPNAYPTYSGYHSQYYQQYPGYPYPGYGYPPYWQGSYGQYAQQYGYGNFRRGGGLGILGAAGLILLGFFAMIFFLFFFILMFGLLSSLGGLFGGGDTSDLLLLSAVSGLAD